MIQTQIHVFWFVFGAFRRVHGSQALFFRSLLKLQNASQARHLQLHLVRPYPAVPATTAFPTRVRRRRWCLGIAANVALLAGAWISSGDTRCCIAQHDGTAAVLSDVLATNHMLLRFNSYWTRNCGPDRKEGSLQTRGSFRESVHTSWKPSHRCLECQRRQPFLLLVLP